MGVKFKTVKDNFPKMEKVITSLKGKKVKVGVGGEENAWLAGIHEYGVRIKVTDAMRNYLHKQGVHLRKETTEIVIPERSFLRSGHDANAESVLKSNDKVLGAVLAGEYSEGAYLNGLGQQMSGKIKRFARSLNSPPNSSFTTEQKGSSNPLVDTGQMINAITWEVE